MILTLPHQTDKAKTGILHRMQVLKMGILHIFPEIKMGILHILPIFAMLNFRKIGENESIQKETI